jgi:hypothetical protein
VPFRAKKRAVPLHIGQVFQATSPRQSKSSKKTVFRFFVSLSSVQIVHVDVKAEKGQKKTLLTVEKFFLHHVLIHRLTQRATVTTSATQDAAQRQTDAIAVNDTGNARTVSFVEPAVTPGTTIWEPIAALSSGNTWVLITSYGCREATDKYASRKTTFSSAAFSSALASLASPLFSSHLRRLSCCRPIAHTSIQVVRPSNGN